MRLKNNSLFSNRKPPESLCNCKLCGEKPSVKLIKKIRKIPDIPTFDPACLYYQVECKTCKAAGTNNTTGEYNDKDAAYAEWNNINTTKNQIAS